MQIKFWKNKGKKNAEVRNIMLSSTAVKESELVEKIVIFSCSAKQSPFFGL